MKKIIKNMIQPYRLDLIDFKISQCYRPFQSNLRQYPFAYSLLQTFQSFRQPLHRPLTSLTQEESVYGCFGL